MRLYLAILALALEGQLAPALAQGVQPQGQAGTPGQQAATKAMPERRNSKRPARRRAQILP